MPDLLDDYQLAYRVKLNPIITRAQPKVARQIAAQRLCSADRRPIFQFFQQPVNAVENRVPELGQFFRRFGRELDVCHVSIIRDYDTHVNSQTGY